MNNRFHFWYDSLQEPWRILTFFVLVLPGMLVVTYWDSIPGKLFGLVLLFVVGFSRWYFLVTPKEKKDGQETVQ